MFLNSTVDLLEGSLSSNFEEKKGETGFFYFLNYAFLETLETIFRILGTARLLLVNKEANGCIWKGWAVAQCYFRLLDYFDLITRPQ